jgi:putative ABC transport system permease protein
VIRPRTRKLLGDVRTSFGRIAAMTIAIAVAVIGFGAILVAKEAISNDAATAYRSTNPAAATLDLPEGVDDAVLDRVRARPDIAQAAARATVNTRVNVGGTWLPLRLFVVPDSDPLAIATMTVERGDWRTGSTGFALERAAVTLLGSDVGDTLTVANASGAPVSVDVTARVWNPALAPAVQERTGYAFVTPAFVESLGFTAPLDQLLITVADPAGNPTRDQTRVDAAANDLADWLVAAGYPVHSVTAPPYQHPHQNQTDTVTNLLVGFAFASLVLAGVLVASTLGGLLAGQTRQIGSMKAVGATRGAIVRLYLGLTVSIAATATVLAAVPSVLGGRALATLVGDLLNVTIVSTVPSLGVILAIAAAGLLVPVTVAMAPVLRAARVTVREAISDVGARGGRAETGGRFTRLLSRFGGGDRIPVFAARNLARRPRRFAATVALLATGGALFLAGLNSAGAWQQWVDDGLSRRSYDVALGLASTPERSAVAAAIASTPGLAAWDGLLSVPATPLGADGTLVVERIYPDGGHGAFAATTVDPASDFTSFAIRDGRWLQPGDSGTVVLNQAAATRLGDPAIGERVSVSAEGTTISATVVGIVNEVGGGAIAYLPTGAADAVVGASDLVTNIRLVASPGADVAAMTDTVRSELAAAGIEVVSTVPTAELRTAIDQHVVVFIAILVALAVIMAVIGALGLASAMSMSVTERTREFGIMNAIGAPSRVVLGLVVTEGVLTGLVGLAIAVVAMVPVSLVVGSTLGRLAFNQPLPLVLSGQAVVIWAVAAVVGAALASLSAALRSARLTVREALAHQ